MLVNIESIKHEIKRVVHLLVAGEFNKLLEENLLRCITVDKVKNEIFEGYPNENDEFTSYTLLDLPEESFSRVSGFFFYLQKNI